MDRVIGDHGDTVPASVSSIYDQSDAEETVRSVRLEGDQ